VAEERQAKLLAEERERDRALHFMKCPKCGMQLEEIAFGDVRVDKCFSCDGLWLDKGELDLIREKDGGFMGRLLSVFGADAPSGLGHRGCLDKTPRIAGAGRERLGS
jgi:hypothetical protein